MKRMKEQLTLTLNQARTYIILARIVNNKHYKIQAQKCLWQAKIIAMKIRKDNVENRTITMRIAC